MESKQLRPIGATFNEVVDTPTERVITTWRVVGYSQTALGLAELAQPAGVQRIPKTPPQPAERK